MVGLDGGNFASLKWQLHPPAGVARAGVCRDGGQLVAVVAARPFIVSVGGRREVTWQTCARLGDAAAQSAADRALDELLQDEPRLHLSRSAEPPGFSARRRVRVWLTGPDPFVPVQPAVVTLDDSHDDLADIRGGRVGAGLLKDSAWLRWRYRDHPTNRYDLMEIRSDRGCEGIVVVREARIRGRKTIVILELHATTPTDHYALLKAARKLAWDRGGLPVVLLDDDLDPLFALTAGYFAVPRRWLAGFQVSLRGIPHAGWSARFGDWTEL
jgi:hypothetical protein